MRLFSSHDCCGRNDLIFTVLMLAISNKKINYEGNCISPIGSYFKYIHINYNLLKV